MTVKKIDVRVGEHYTIKVGGMLTIVRIDAEATFASGGWFGINLRTGKRIRIRTARRLRSALTPLDVENYMRERNKPAETSQ